MRLELIHGLFITSTEFRLSTTFIQLVSFITTSILLGIQREHDSYIHGTFPLLLSPLADFLLLPFPALPYLLGTLLAVTGSIHLVPRLLVN